MKNPITALAGKAVLGLAGSGGAGIVITGGFVGTLQFEGTVDNGGTWVPLDFTPVNGGTAVHQVTAPGSWVADVEGLSAIRVRASAWTSGTALIGFATTAGIVGPTGPAGANGTNGATGATGPQGPTDPMSMIVHGQTDTAGFTVGSGIDRSVGCVVQNFAPTTYTGVRGYWLHGGADTVVVKAWVAGVAVATGTGTLSADGLFSINFAVPYTVAAGVSITFSIRCTSSLRYTQFSPVNTPFRFLSPLMAGRWTYQKLSVYGAGDAAPANECYIANNVGIPIEPVPQ